MAKVRQSGIYAIWNTVSGKVYVGSSVCLATRKHRHFDDLKNNKHANSYLQRAYVKHGEIVFRFTVVETCSPEKLIEREQFWIDEFKVTHSLYNLSPTAGNQLGIKRSEETKRRMSEALRGRKLSEESKQKMRLAKLGTRFKAGAKLSDESRKRISEAKKGTVVSNETKAKLSQVRKGNKNALGTKQSAETVRKRVEATLRTKALKKAGAK